MDAVASNLYATLYDLLIKELNDLSIGKSFNQARLKKMKEVCHLLMFYTQYDLSKDKNILNFIRLYE